jgi:hypothetical protein
MPKTGYDNAESQNGAAQGAGENQEDLENEQAANAGEYPDDPDELKERLKKTEEVRDKNYARMKKAEGFVQDKDGKWVKPEKQVEKPKTTEQGAPAATDDNISTKDAMALMNAKVTDEEDIDKVAKFAKLNGLTIREALKDSVVVAILADSAEKRRTANATNTGKTRTGTTKATGEVLHEKASKTGELPDSEEDMAKLAEQHLDQMSK